MDEFILLLINGHHNVWLNEFMWSVTGTLPWIFFFLSLLWLVLKSNQRKEALLIFFCVALTVLLADQLCASLIKPWVGRLRPTHDPAIMGRIQTVNDYVGGLYSFPSNHASNTFAVATFFSLLVRHWRMTLTCFSWASLSCYSRMYLGVHYPSDIFCGACIGALIGFGCYRLYRYTARRMQFRGHYYHSMAFTSSGYSEDDLDVVSVAFLATLVVMMF